MKTLIRILVSTALLGGLMAVPTALSAAAPAAEKAPVATGEKAPAPAAEKATEVAKTEAATNKRPTYRSRIDRLRDRNRFRHYGLNDGYRHWADQRHQAMKDWADFRNEDWKRYVSARNFWNNPWAETRRQMARQRSDAMRAYMEDMHHRHTYYIDSTAPPIYRGGFYDYDPFLY